MAEGGGQTLAFVGVNGPAFPFAVSTALVAAVPFARFSYRFPAAQLATPIACLPSPLIVADRVFAHALADAAAAVIATDQWLERSEFAEPAPPEEAGDGDPAVLLFTSGTTAALKSVIIKHENLFSYALGTVKPRSCDPTDAALANVPPYHIAGVGTVLTTLLADRRLVYLNDFTPARMAPTRRRGGRDLAMLVPTMLARSVDELDGVPADLPTLRTIAYGGALLPLPVLERALRVLPSVAFVTAYGPTETSSTITVFHPARSSRLGPKRGSSGAAAVDVARMPHPGPRGRDPCGREHGVAGRRRRRALAPGPQVHGECGGWSLSSTRPAGSHPRSPPVRRRWLPVPRRAD